MHTVFARAFVSLALLALPTACDSNGGSGPGGSSGQNTATLTGPFANDPLAVSVLWQITTQQDYTYILGSGTTSGGKASINVPLSTDNAGKAAIDPLALNTYDDGSSVGVGYAIVTAASDAPTQAAKAKGNGNDLQLKGISARYAYIFRNDDGEHLTIDWAKGFPQGLSCGRCVPKPPGQSGAFDSWEPIDCATFEIQTATDIQDLDVCNWT